MILVDAGSLWRNRYGEFETHVRGLYKRSQAAYHAFDDLPRLVDQMRILSVNAELAAARAGDYGRGVRVLTQFASEAVGRLAGVVREMLILKRRTYAQAAMVLRAAGDIGKLESAGNRILVLQGVYTKQSLAVLDGAWHGRLVSVGMAAKELRKAHDDLVMVVRGVREMMMQADIISANIAIEATTAGPFETQLQAVAESMRTSGAQLRTMVDNASHSLRDAAETDIAMANFAAVRVGGSR